MSDEQVKPQPLSDEELARLRDMMALTSHGSRWTDKMWPRVFVTIDALRKEVESLSIACGNRDEVLHSNEMAIAELKARTLDDEAIHLIASRAAYAVGQQVTCRGSKSDVGYDAMQIIEATFRAEIERRREK